MRTQIEFINHASVLISKDGIGLLSDPWFNGQAFHKGWSLLAEQNSEEIRRLLCRVTHIWISHEHPDHFSINFFNQYAEELINNGIIVLFQKTKDCRVKNFLETRGLKVRELEFNKVLKISSSVELVCIKDGFYDSALYIQTGDLKILNLNDCEIKTRDSVDNIKKIIGSVDVLMSQFSYAAWKGGKKNVQFRKNAALSKIQALKVQCDTLQPKFLIPFASFVYFSNERNFYLNDSANHPNVILNQLTDFTNIVLMKPFDIFSGIWSDSDNHKSIEFWNSKLNIIKPRIENKFRIVESEALEKSYVGYNERIRKNNNINLIKLVKIFGVGGGFKPIRIFLDDIDATVEIDITKKNLYFFDGMNNPDLTMASESLDFIFKNPFGFDTLTVNGCFEESNIGGFIKASKTLAIENFNNLGYSFEWKVLLNVGIIFLFLKRLSLVRKQLKRV